ncbi:MAG TPA: DUF6770 family protein [Hanamia sp.]|jgi:hypothetical protein
MKKQALTLLLSVSIFVATAQTKIFKEVSEDISTQTRGIIQDNSLVGYVIFTRLEKASADSFNYRITLMDENLNDIGRVNFTEIGLDLEGVAFDRDVLCLAYLKSTTQGKVFKSKRQARKSDLEDDVLIQFLTLNGQIAKTNTLPVNLNSTLTMTGNTWGFGGFQYTGGLKHQVQLQNVAGKGFACFYGDAAGCNLIAYDFKGNQLWKKSIDDKQAFALLASKSDIYLLEKEKEKYIEGGGSLTGYNFEDGKSYPKIAMQDKDGRSLTMMSFGTDPVTGNPFICGKIIDKRNGNKIGIIKNYTHAPYDGVYTMDVNGHNKKDLKETFVYWNDGSQKPAISKLGYRNDTKSFTVLTSAFRDYNGNTYFVGSQLIKKVKIGSIIASVITAPTIIAPIMILGAGTSKCKLLDANVVKLSSKGTLSLDNTIACNNSSFWRSNTDFITVNGGRNFYSLDDPESKGSFVIADDSKNIMIYNVDQKKIVRTIPHKSEGVRTTIGPAKDGHFMVIEYNKKDKYTRLSIESLK